MNKQKLDSLEAIKKLDKKNMLSSIDSLDKQVKHAWTDANKINTNIHPPAGGPISNVIVAGMGGSGLGADLIKSVFKSKLEIPFDFVHSYTLPNYVNENSLVILASYSGNTEEIVACHEQAKKAGAQIMVIAAGGELDKIAKENKYPIYLINPKYNPSDQPRMAIGYAVFGTVALLAKAGILSVSDKEVEEVVQAIQNIQEKNNQKVIESKNFAKQLAWKLLNLRPILIAAEHMEGSIHASVNQFNENAKIFADYKIVPELNHHLMEGLGFPDTNQSTHYFVLLNSNLYNERNQKRIRLTQEILNKYGLSNEIVELKSKSKLAQAFESLALFAYVNFYLSMLENIDPAPIPYVDWFKEELSVNC